MPLTHFTEKHRFSNKKKGVSAILKSELKLNLENLKTFKKSYLNTTTKELYDHGTLKDIADFYYYLSKFPIISHENWDKLISFIPDIFSETHIKQIIEFNVKLDDLQNQSKILYEKGMPNRTYSALWLYELEPDDYEITLGTYSLFENKINCAISLGEGIIESIT